MRREHVDGWDRRMLWSLRISAPAGLLLIGLGAIAGSPLLAAIGAMCLVYLLATGLGWLIYTS